MKIKYTLATLAISAGLGMMVFAANVETCAQKHSSCTNHCENLKAGCKSRQSDPDKCEKDYQACIQKCDKDKSDCEAKEKPAKAPAKKK